MEFGQLCSLQMLERRQRFHGSVGNGNYFVVVVAVSEWPLGPGQDFGSAALFDARETFAKEHIASYLNKRSAVPYVGMRTSFLTLSYPGRAALWPTLDQLTC